MDCKELPKEFLEKMKNLLGDAYGDYLDSFGAESFHGLRVNTLKCSPGEFPAVSPWPLRPVPWIHNGFYYDGEDKPARHPYYYAGLFYLQEPSAMTPASLLPVEPGDCVLDLCAAPGGKSTELAAKLQGGGLLFANDISSSRARALLKNLELCGAANIMVASEAPEKLAEYFGGFFDKILVDAPCSGEGMFRRDADMVKSWSEKGPDYYCKIQRAIMEEAVRMLKPGGKLLYSTCTFDTEENEGTVRAILERHPEMSLLMPERHEGFEAGIGMPECVRLFPHRIGGEGHFIALLQKSGGDGTGDTAGHVARPYPNLKKDELAAVMDFLGGTGRTFDTGRIYAKNESVYYLPEPFLRADPRLLSKIRYLRTGLLLGELKKGRFEPSQALAMSLNDGYSDTVNLDIEDGRVMRYLKGETVSLSAEEQRGGTGWCLVCAGGFPLGWAKRQGGSLKNKYYPGWRWQ